jgi:hypothetical protein
MLRRRHSSPQLPFHVVAELRRLELSAVYATTSLSGLASSAAIDAAAWALDNVTTLEELVLDRNAICTAICGVLLASVHANETIRHVGLDGNPVAEEALQELRCALKLNVEYGRSFVR